MKPSLCFLVILSLLPLALGDSDCSSNVDLHMAKVIPLKLTALFSILFGGAFGICLPIAAGKYLPALRPEKDAFFIFKAFAAGVILATGFIHILPAGFETLTSPCLPISPWGVFPFAEFIAMVAAIGTSMVDSVATAYYSSTHFSKKPVASDGEKSAVDRGKHVQVHTHDTHGHSDGSTADDESYSSSLTRHTVISQVLELGIVVHLVIIGISLGASKSPSAIKPLVAALSFHQFFEGIGLGGCIVQAKFNACSMVTMILFFSLATPTGIAIGVGISSAYDENSPTALILEGVLNSSSAGILIYTDLVYLLATDFMDSTVRSSGKLQLGVCVSLLIGAGSMSLIPTWA